MNIQTKENLSTTQDLKVNPFVLCLWRNEVSRCKTTSLNLSLAVALGKPTHIFQAPLDDVMVLRANESLYARCRTNEIIEEEMDIDVSDDHFVVVLPYGTRTQTIVDGIMITSRVLAASVANRA